MSSLPPKNPSPFSAYQAPQPVPPTNSNKTCFIVLAVLGGFGFLCLLACCGVSYFLFQQAMDLDADVVADHFGNHPQVVQRLGGIDECSLNLFASLREEERRNETDLYVYDVQGPLGSGQLITKEPLDGTVTFVWAKLRINNEEWPLELDPILTGPTE